MTVPLPVLDPATTAVLTMELQEGVCGALSRIVELRDAVAAQALVETTARLLRGARAVGARVVHCTFSVRADGAGTNFDLPLLRGFRDDPGYLRQGSPAAALLDGRGAEPGDIVAERHHGVSPFGGTTLGRQLAALGVTTVVVAGVSLNVGVPGAVIEAVNAGFRVVVAADAVVGIPVEYGEQVLAHALRVIATVADADSIVASLHR